MVDKPGSVQNQVSRRAEVQARQAVLQVRDRQGSRGLEKAEWSGRLGSKHNWQRNGGQKQARVRRAEASRRRTETKQNRRKPGRQKLGNRDKRLFGW